MDFWSEVQDPVLIAMSGTLENVPLVSIRSNMNTVPKKQLETVCHSFLLVGIRNCVGYRHAQLVRLSSAFSKLTTGLVVVLLYSRLPGRIVYDV